MKQIRDNWLFVLVLVVGCPLAASAQEEGGGAGAYDLGQLPDGFAVRWPEPPAVEHEVEAATAEEFDAAAAEGATRIVVTASIPSTVAIRGSDVEVQMAEGVSVHGLVIDRQTERIHLRGGSYGGAGITMAYPAVYSPRRSVSAEWMIRDVLIDGVDVQANSETTALTLRGERVALVNSRAHGGQYAIWSDTEEPLQNSDMIIAGNELEAEGDQATVRLVGVRHAVVVENRLENLLQSGRKHNFRVHAASDQVYAARNLLVNAGSMLGTMPNDDVGELWFEDNEIHHVTDDLFNPDPRQIAILHARNNVAYSARRCFVCIQPGALWDVDDNEVLPYEPVKE